MWILLRFGSHGTVGFKLDGRNLESSSILKQPHTADQSGKYCHQHFKSFRFGESPRTTRASQHCEQNFLLVLRVI